MDSRGDYRLLAWLVGRSELRRIRRRSLHRTVRRTCEERGILVNFIAKQLLLIPRSHLPSQPCVNPSVNAIQCKPNRSRFAMSARQPRTREAMQTLSMLRNRQCNNEFCSVNNELIRAEPSDPTRVASVKVQNLPNYFLCSTHQHS